MSTYIKRAVFMLSLLFFSGVVSAKTSPVDEKVVAFVSELSIIHTSGTSVRLVWDAWGAGNGEFYTITVKNLTESEAVRTFTTSSTSLDVVNLKQGNSYLFSVKKNDYIIIDPTEM